jgi:hypothetical protein
MDKEKNKNMDKVTILTIGDPHFKITNIEDSKAFVEKCVLKAKEISPDAIVVLGDILDRHANIHTIPLTLAMEFLDKLRKISKLFLLIGNHDRINNSDFCSKYSPFFSCKFWENTWVADVPISFSLSNFSFVFVPYVYPGRFIEALTEWNIDYLKAKAIFAHQEFRNCRMGAIVSENGDEWPEDAPLVISGHIHNAQRLQRNIIYVGIPMQHSFGDSTEKTISCFEFLKSDFFETRIDLGLRKRVLLSLSPSDLSSFDLSKYKDKLVKIVIFGLPEEIIKCMKSPEVLSLRNHGCKIVFKTVRNKEKEKNREITSLSGISIEKRSFFDILSDSCDDELRRELAKILEA